MRTTLVDLNLTKVSSVSARQQGRSNTAAGGGDKKDGARESSQRVNIDQTLNGTPSTSPRNERKRHTESQLNH